jgi:hypothetical protein
MSPSFTTNKLKFHWLTTPFQNPLLDVIGSGIVSHFSEPLGKKSISFDLNQGIKFLSGLFFLKTKRRSNHGDEKDCKD